METINKLENIIEGWLKPLPHLPTSWREWLSKNVWWITLIGVIISVLGILVLVPALLYAFAFFGAATSFMGYVSSGAATYSTWWIVVSIVSLALLVITTVIEAMAISPLKAMKQKGWDLLFLVFFIGIISGIASAIVNHDMTSIISSLVGTIISSAISAYFLFEIRSYFKSVPEVKKAE